MRQCLVVNQDSDDGAELSALFRGFGFATTHSASADDALRSCQKNPPELVVVSGSLDSDPSSDLVRRLRRTGQGRPPVVLVYSREPDLRQISRYIVDGAAECLMKPLDSDILAFKLRQVGLI